MCPRTHINFRMNAKNDRLCDPDAEQIVLKTCDLLQRKDMYQSVPVLHFNC